MIASRRMVLGGALPIMAGAANAHPIGPTDLDDFLSAEQKRAAAAARPVDCTAAFAKALATGKRVSVGPGHYGLESLRLPNGGGLIGTGGAVLHQLAPDRPTVTCVSDKASGQLADIVLDAVTIVGHPGSRTAVVRLEARGGYAIWRSHFAFFAQNVFRALEVEAADANNIFECQIAIVCEGSSDTAVLIRGGVYNRYHLFLTRTRTWALDDSSNASDIRVVAENSVIFRGQTNRINARVEGISADRPADTAAITDRGFGNTFDNAEVNMPVGDAGKLTYAFRAFQRSIFVNPQIIGPGAPMHPFAPTSNFPFTVIGGRSRARNKVEAVFDGSDPDHDPRNITFVGDAGDFTSLANGPATPNVQRFRPAADMVMKIAVTTQLVLIDGTKDLDRVALIFSALRPRNDWLIEIATTHAIAALDWPRTDRFAGLPGRLSAGGRLRLLFDGDRDRWMAA